MSQIPIYLQGEAMAQVSFDRFDSTFLRSVDANLNHFLGKLDSGAPLEHLVIEIEEWLNSITDSAPESRLGTEKNKLMRPDWKRDWTEEATISLLLLPGEPAFSALSSLEHLLFGACMTQLARFVAEGESHLIRLYRSRELRTSLSEYLSTRGYSVTDQQGFAEKHSIPTFDELAVRLLPLDLDDGDWITANSMASFLGIEPIELTRRRNNRKALRAGIQGAFHGCHNGCLFWRTQKSKPKYFLPLAKEHCGQLGKIFPNLRLD